MMGRATRQSACPDLRHQSKEGQNGSEEVSVMLARRGTAVAGDGQGNLAVRPWVLRADAPRGAARARPDRRGSRGRGGGGPEVSAS